MWNMFLHMQGPCNATSNTNTQPTHQRIYPHSLVNLVKLLINLFQEVAYTHFSPPLDMELELKNS